jgi:hypothetical protein
MNDLSWWQDWRGECVAIIASGPSAKNAQIEKLRDRIHLIAINESYRLCPWAEILYGCDAAWWKLRSGVPEFSGLKILGVPDPTTPEILRDEKSCEKFDLRRVQVAAYSDDILTENPGRLGCGGNSGFQALNLAVQFGVTGILLVGFDMQQPLHWHGRHPQPLRNLDESCFPRWRKAFLGISLKLRRLGADIVNTSFESALTAYPKMTIDAALTRWGL